MTEMQPPRRRERREEKRPIDFLLGVCLILLSASAVAFESAVEKTHASTKCPHFPLGRSWRLRAHLALRCCDGADLSAESNHLCDLCAERAVGRESASARID